jgi:hypothetical protein
MTNCPFCGLATEPNRKGPDTGFPKHFIFESDRQLWGGAVMAHLGKNNLKLSSTALWLAFYLAANCCSHDVNGTRIIALKCSRSVSAIAEHSGVPVLDVAHGARELDRKGYADHTRSANGMFTSVLMKAAPSAGISDELRI